MASNIKGWIGFLVITVIIIGGVMTAHQVLPSKVTGTAITGISASGVNGFYNSSNQTFTANVSDSTSNVTFTMTISSSAASGSMNLTVVAPAVQNISAYNSTYHEIYSKLYNQTVNSTVSSGTVLNASVNKSIAENVSRLASTYTYQNITYQVFKSFTENVTYSGGSYTFNFTRTLNATAIKLMAKGEGLFVVMNAAAGPNSSNGFILLTKQ